MPARRFPPPWSVEELDACFVVTDSAGQKFAYVYFEDEPGRRNRAQVPSKNAKLCCRSHLCWLILLIKGNVEQIGGSHEYDHDDDLLGQSCLSLGSAQVPHLGVAAANPLPPRAGRIERRHFARHRDHTLRRASRDEQAPLDGITGAIAMAHFAGKFIDKQKIDRVESAVLLSLIAGGLTLCVLGAAVYDIGRAFSVW
jgi:hypothetical protein